MKYYLVVCWGDIEPEVMDGSFDTEKEICDTALAMREKIGPEDDGIYWLKIDDNGIPEIGTWSGAFMEPANNKYWARMSNESVIPDLE